MSDAEGHFNQGLRRPVLPPISTRTLHHPSILPLCMAASFEHHHRLCEDPRVHPITHAEIFYSDPTCGRRIPNIVSDLGVFDVFQLNTPQPVMSTCLTSPSCPDPFTSGPHPTRDLGCPEWSLIPCHSPEQPTRVILQLTQEEDQAITILLQLYHQEPGESDETLTAAQLESSPVAEPQERVNKNTCFFFTPEPAVFTSAEDVYKPVLSDGQHPEKAGLQNGWLQGRWWSDTELEAAETLLSCLTVMKEERVWAQKTVATLPDLPPSSGFPCVSENGDPGLEDFCSAEKRMLSDSEKDALCVLLSLTDVGI